MQGDQKPERAQSAKVQALGDKSILVVFATQLTLEANRKATAFTTLVNKRIGDLILCANSNLLSVIIQYEPNKVSFQQLRQELQLLLSTFNPEDESLLRRSNLHDIQIEYGGEVGVDFEEVCRRLETKPAQFIKKHSKNVLDVLSLGFSPGFIYLGLHNSWRHFPRRESLQENVPAGAVLFAAGQTAITSVPIRTGWSVIGQSNLNNFDIDRDPIVLVQPGDRVKILPKK